MVDFLERSGMTSQSDQGNFKELKQAPKKSVSVSENLFDTEPISAPENSSDKEQDSARKDSINEAPVSREEAQLPQETPASGEIQLLQKTQLQQGAKSPRQVQLRQAVQSSNELSSASEPPEPACSHSQQKPLQFRQKKTSTSSQQPVRKRKSRLSFPLVSPFAHFQRGICQSAGKSSRRIWFTFQEDQCVLRNNRFLQYGYYNFGHLLLCKRADGRYILGVPGSYDQQEQFMAGMFGFSCFKESPLIKVKKGRGGYWYRIIDSPVCH